MKKMLSIIIPNYNKGKFLKKCLNSIIAQKLNDYELIIIDDASTDDSVRILNEYEKHYDSIKIIKHHYNKGGSISRNEGIDIATGRYIMFFDSDDYLENNVLNNLLNKIEQNDADLVIGNYYDLYEDKKIVNKRKVSNNLFITQTDIFEKVLNISPVPGNKIYKLDVIKNSNIYWSNLKLNQDLNFYYKYLLFAKKVITVEDKIYSHRYLENSTYNIRNFNLFDSVNAFKDINIFYQKNNSEKLYNKYIVLMNFINCQTNLYKIIHYKSYKDRLLICEFCKVEESKLKYKESVCYNQFKKNIIKFRLKIFLKYIYCSNIFIVVNNYLGKK